MANRLLYCLPLLAALAACSTHDSPQKAAATDSPKQQAAAEKLRIPLGDPALIDSSDYVLYPLSLRDIENEDSGEYGSYGSSGRTATYWNILFYNTKTTQNHLLSAQKMFIRSYTSQGLGSSAGGLSKDYLQVYAADKLLYYSVVTTDFNYDGHLTLDDPTYLFISDKNGENFRQISPDSLHVTGWEIQKATGKILMQAMQDSNHDRKFGEGDEAIPYVYDIATQQPARRVFSPASMEQLRTRFWQQWAKKP